MNAPQQVISVSTGYEPRPLQLAIHREMRRFSVLAIHRRFGKTVLAVNHLIDSMLKCPLHNPRVGYIAPFLKQAKAVAWDYAKDYTANIPGVKQYESELRIDIPVGEVNGKRSIARLMLFGADHPDSLRGLYFDDIVFDEFAQQPITIWTDVCRPALADRKGGALFIGTPAGKDHFYDKYQEASRELAEGNPEWYCQTFRADETEVIDAVELASARQSMDESSYRQEFLCDWAAAIKGSFYADQMGRAADEGRVLRIPYESNLPVLCAFDLGIDDETAVWFFQCFRSEIRLINYKAWTNRGLLDVLKEIKEMPYVYGEFIMPWDIDQRELTTGRTRLEVIESLGFDILIAPRPSVEDGINAVRTILSQCWFDKINCEEGIDCLENYRKKFDHRTGQFLMRPEHDKFSHGADAFRYLALGYDDHMGKNFTGGGGPKGGSPTSTRST